VRRLALRGLLAHKGRLVATAVAVVLGVSFVAGTFVLTDTLRAAINGVIQQSQANIAVLVQPRAADARSGQEGGAFVGGTLTLPQSTVARVAAVPGVAAADAVAGGPVQVFAPDGRALTGGVSFALALSVGRVPDLRVLTLRQGHWPRGPDQADLDVATAGRAAVRLGQRVRVAGAGAARRVQVVGLVGYGQADSLAGATIVGLTLPATQSVLDQPGRIAEVAASAAPGVTPAQLRARVAVALGPGVRVQTQAQAIAQATASVDKGFSVFGDVLLVFAGVALFTAVFLIFNTFSILLAQRARELALLRCLGAFRRQLVLTVLGEAAIIGLVASVLGLLLGVLLALGIRDLLAQVGVRFPGATPVVALRTVVVALAVGVGTTMLAALLPALRGSATPPVRALRDDPAPDRGRPSLVRIALGAGLAVLGAVVVAQALAGGRGGSASRRAEAAGLGLLLVFLGVTALVPVVAHPLAGALGWPLARLRGVPGKLGRNNAMRHPRRTAATAAALMIGVTLVTTIGVFSRSVQTSVDVVLQDHLHAQVVVTAGNVGGLSTSAGDRLAADPRLTSVAALSSGRARPVLGGLPARGRLGVTGTDVLPYARDVDIPPTAGSLAAVSGRAVAVTTGVAQQYHLGLGSVLALASDAEPASPYRVAAIIHDPTGITGDVLMAPDGFATLLPGTDQVSVLLARAAPGTAPAAAARSAAAALSGYPQASVYTKQGFIDHQNSQFEQLIGIVQTLLGLAVVIALFGIVNTLALSVVERTREIGLLRALGLSRRQLRATVRAEAVVVALLGTVLGIALGLAFSWVVVDALRSDGLDRFAVPWDQLLAYLVVAALAGVVAAVLPARSAAKVDVLEAIAAE
jgi:putative ABC transport system permease protein